MAVSFCRQSFVSTHSNFPTPTGVDCKLGYQGKQFHGSMAHSKICVGERLFKDKLLEIAHFSGDKCPFPSLNFAPKSPPTISLLPRRPPPFQFSGLQSGQIRLPTPAAVGYEMVFKRGEGRLAVRRKKKTTFAALKNL